MRHQFRGRKLGRSSSHRHAMFRNMACSLIHTVQPDDDDPRKPKVEGRIVTTVAKAKELRPFIERLITLAKKALPHADLAEKLTITADRNTPEWKEWRQSSRWQEWNQAVAPVVALRRRAFAILRDKRAVRILFSDLATRFEKRPGGYTRVVRLPEFRLGDAGQKALIEFVGVRDRVKARKEGKKKLRVVKDAPKAAETPAPAAPEAAAEGAPAST